MLSIYLMANEFRQTYDSIHDNDRRALSEKLYAKLEVLGFSEHVRQQIRTEIKKLKHNSFELPARQVSFISFDLLRVLFTKI